MTAAAQLVQGVELHERPVFESQTCPAAIILLMQKNKPGCSGCAHGLMTNCCHIIPPALIAATLPPVC